jgi:predicted Zn-dependent protease
MILLHEQLKAEANFLQGVIEDVFKIPVSVSEHDLTAFLQKISEVEDFYSDDPNSNGQLGKQYQDKAVLLLTTREIFGCFDMNAPFSADEQWSFAATSEDGPYHLVSTSRLKENSERYFRRIELLAIHELGHELVGEQKDYKDAYWVNAVTGRRCPLGRHCDCNRCVMYEVMAIETPDPKQEYLELDGDLRDDAGLDDHLERVAADWFCGRCKANICVPLPYFA